MTLKHFTQKQIHPNPYQTRVINAGDPEIIALAVSIQEHGLQETPTARPHPEKPGCVQLVKGHRRFVAWFIASKEPMPIDVQDDLTDRQMFDYNVIENSQRADLTPIEVAKQIELYIKTFNVSQADAAKIFGLKTQAAVSNKLRLLQLPAAVQTMVSTGAIAERNGRALVGITKFQKGAAEKIAKAAAKLEPEQRESHINEEIISVMEKNAIDLNQAPFDLKWLNKPIAIEHDEVKELRACDGCPDRFDLKNDYDDGSFCTRAACYTCKVDHFRRHELERCSIKLKVAIANGEITQPFFRGHYDHVQVARKALANAETRALLRLAPMDDENASVSTPYNLQDVLGSRVLELRTTDQNLLSRLQHAKDPKAAGKPLTPEKQKQQEETERAARRADKASALKAKHDVSWLIINATRLIGERLDIGSGLLPTLLDSDDHRWLPDPPVGGRELLADYEEKLEESVSDKKINAAERLAQRKELLAFKLVATQSVNYYDSDKYNWKDTHEEIDELLSANMLNLKLPTGWDKVPVHHTDYNCWHCGDFASGTRLTNRDIESGWSATSQGGKTLDVCCPSCHGGHKPAAKAKKEAKKK
jgi:ParB/RepB/Spo0J family partition protein